MPDDLTESEREHHAERAAILQYDAGRARHVADAEARRQVLAARWRRRAPARG